MTIVLRRALYGLLVRWTMSSPTTPIMAVQMLVRAPSFKSKAT